MPMSGLGHGTEFLYHSRTALLSKSHPVYISLQRVADSRNQALGPPTPCPSIQRSQKLGRVEEVRRDPSKCREPVQIGFLHAISARAQAMQAVLSSAWRCPEITCVLADLLGLKILDVLSL